MSQPKNKEHRAETVWRHDTGSVMFTYAKNSGSMQLTFAECCLYEMRKGPS
jgi:hypothetical protein